MHTNFKSNLSTFYCIVPHRLQCSQLSDYNEITGGSARPRSLLLCGSVFKKCNYIIYHAGNRQQMYLLLLTAFLASTEAKKKKKKKCTRVNPRKQMNRFLFCSPLDGISITVSSITRLLLHYSKANYFTVN